MYSVVFCKWRCRTLANLVPPDALACFMLDDERSVITQELIDFGFPAPPTRSMANLRAFALRADSAQHIVLIRATVWAVVVVHGVLGAVVAFPRINIHNGGVSRPVSLVLPRLTLRLETRKR